MDGIRALSFADPGQQATIRVLGNVADDAVLLSGRAGGQTILQGVTVEGGFEVGAGDLRLFDATPPGASPSTDRGYLFGSAIPSGVVTEVSGQLLTLAVNMPQVGARDTARVGGILRLDTRSTQQLFSVRSAATGGSVEVNRFTINLETGLIQLAPAGGSNIAFFGAGSFGGGLGVVFLANRTTAPSSNPVGGVIPYAHPVATGKSNLLVKNEDGKTARLTGVDARVAADFSKTNATLANVTGLSFDVEAGKTYSFVARIYSNANSTGGQKYAMGGTCTATAFLSHVRIFHDTDTALKIVAQQPTFGGENGTTNAAGPGYVEISGTITVNAAGTFTVQFAQVTPSGTSTVLRGSTFHLREIT